MRISIRHLLIGMSLGAVVVFIYGYIKLDNKTDKLQTQEQKLVESDVNTYTYDLNQIVEPKINDLINIKTQPQVEFIEINKFKQKPLESANKNPTPTPSPIPQAAMPTQTLTNPNYNTTKESPKVQSINAPKEVIILIEKYAAEYGVDKNMMIGIAKCESTFREDAVNGPYAGIYQFVSGTWISNRRAMGLDESLNLRYNAEESIRTAAFKMSRDGFGAWPVCQYKAQGLVASNQGT